MRYASIKCGRTGICCCGAGRSTNNTKAKAGRMRRKYRCSRCKYEEKKEGRPKRIFFSYPGTLAVFAPDPAVTLPRNELSPDWQKTRPDIPFSSLICASPRSSPSASQSPAHPTATAIRSLQPQVLTADPSEVLCLLTSPLSFE